MKSLQLLFLIVCLTFAQAQLTLKKCCEGNVCFENPIISLMPMPNCVEDIKPTMTLFTRRRASNGVLMTRNFIPSIFRGSKLTIFIVHGWQNDITSSWLYDIKNDLLVQGDYNVVVVAWGGNILYGAKNLNYLQSSADTRAVGREIGLIAANVIANASSDRSRLYCVGHSLGSHVCGHAGMTTKFGRITGLDPAGPLFDLLDDKSGLNPSCADLVEAVHTNSKVDFGLALGSDKIRGHVDFYVNGGRRQPGCVFDLSLTDLTQIGNVDMSVACSHGRSFLYYRESILTPCFYARSKCTDQTKLPGSCTNRTTPFQTVGFRSSSYVNKGIFYVETNGKPPYCRN